jgi:hypothetical protein
MKFKFLAIGLLVGSGFIASTMLAQTTATAPATKPATAASATSAQTSTKPTTSTSAPASASANSACLRCHPWAKVAEASAKYVTPEGEKGNPHMYVDLDGSTTKPHSSKSESDIPDCMKCHTAHALSPLPKKGDIDLKKVSVKWCYDACHHEKNFEKCDKCH